MADKTSKPRTGGLLASALSLLGSAGRYVQSLGQLAGFESREALALGTRLAIMLGAAVVFATIGYLFLILTIAFLASFIFGIPWITTLGVLAFFHFGVAYLCARHVRDHLRTPLFEKTRAEIARDLASLSDSPTP